MAAVTSLFPGLTLLLAPQTAYTQVPGPMAGAGAISSEPLTVLDEEDESDEGDDRGVDDIAASVITAIHSAPAVPAEDVVSVS